MIISSAGKIKARIVKAVMQSALIVSLSVLCGLVSNHIRDTRLSLFGMSEKSGQHVDNNGLEENLAISLEKAKDAYFSGKVLFIDARPVELYVRGHIKGAVNLPLDKFNELFDRIKFQLFKKDLIITYCDGESCDLARELAMKLSFQGCEHVRFLKNGWTKWKTNMLPVTTNH